MDRFRQKRITHASAYLYRMASNLCADLLRRRRRSAISLEGVHSSEMPTSKSSSTEAAAAEEIRRIEQVLARIPQRQAEVIRLRVFDGLRLVEIAEVLDCPLGSVKSRLRYGLEDGEDYTLEQVGEKLGLTRERIRQIQAQALRRLRHPSRSRNLKPFLN